MSTERRFSLLKHHHDTDYAGLVHTHAVADTTGLQAALDAKADDIASPTWTAPTLLNSWVNYGSDGAGNNYSPAGYYKDQFGRVYLRGMIRSGTATSETVLFTLPTGFRPGFRILFDTQSDSILGRVDVLPNGEVRILVGTTNWITLEGLSFAVA